MCKTSYSFFFFVQNIDIWQELGMIGKMLPYRRKIYYILFYSLSVYFQYMNTIPLIVLSPTLLPRLVRIFTIACHPVVLLLGRYLVLGTLYPNICSWNCVPCQFQSLTLETLSLIWQMRNHLRSPLEPCASPRPSPMLVYIVRLTPCTCGRRSSHC